MTRRMRPQTALRGVVALVAVTALVLTGCRSDDTGGDGTEAPDDGQAADDGGTDDGGTDDGGGDEERPLGVSEVAETQTFPNGVELTVHRVRVEPDGIFVDLEAFNGLDDVVFLAALEDVFLTDDTGRRYAYQPPEDNAALEIGSGATLEGSVAFSGRIAPDASTLELQFNYREDDGEPLTPPDHQHAELTDAPSFSFSGLPLPSA